MILLAISALGILPGIANFHKDKEETLAEAGIVISKNIEAINSLNNYLLNKNTKETDILAIVDNEVVRKLRRIVRDNQFRGISPINTIKIWPSVRRGEEKNIFPFQEEADIMFNSSLIYELAILKPVAEKVLQTIGPENEEYHEAQRLLSLLQYSLPVVGNNDIPSNSIIREFIGESCFYN